jgi:toxin-antitoxin system PIN domain toxin
VNWLLDGNVLIAMALVDHPHHQRVRRWLASIPNDRWVTCSVTEGTLLRIHMQKAVDHSAAAAWEALKSIRAHPRHLFWADNFSYAEINPTRLTGHRQITDAWLAELARRKGGKLATLDEPLSVLWSESTFLIPV